MMVTSMQVKPDPGISSFSQSLWHTRIPFSQCHPMAGRIGRIAVVGNGMGHIPHDAMRPLAGMMGGSLSGQCCAAKYRYGDDDAFHRGFLHLSERRQTSVAVRRQGGSIRLDYKLEMRCAKRGNLEAATSCRRFLTAPNRWLTLPKTRRLGGNHAEIAERK
jgi:hypothetical protein